MYEEIREARELLELPERATMEEIRASYRRLVSRWHPDRCQECETEVHHQMTQKLTLAYKTILTYCEGYEYSFSEEEVRRYLTGAEWWTQRFGDDPLWGNSNREKKDP